MTCMYKIGDSEKVTVFCHKSTSASKMSWTEEEKEHPTSLWSGEDLLFNCQNTISERKQDTAIADTNLMSATFVTLLAFRLSYVTIVRVWMVESHVINKVICNSHNQKLHCLNRPLGCS